VCYFQVNDAVSTDKILGIAPMCGKSKDNNYFVYWPFANLGGDLKSKDPRIRPEYLQFVQNYMSALSFEKMVELIK
jgi:hypothetical protein